MIALAIAVADVAAGVSYQLVTGHSWLYRDLHREAERRAIEREYRRAHPLYHHDLRKNVSVEGVVWGPLQYRVATDDLGFKTTARSRRYESPQRWLALGDSFVEGVGYAFRATAIGRLEDELGLKIYNAGVASYSPVIYRRKLRYLLDDVGLKFERLLLFLDISDARDEMRFYRYADSCDCVVARSTEIDGWFDGQADVGEPLSWASSTGLKGWAERNTMLTFRVLDYARGLARGDGVSRYAMPAPLHPQSDRSDAVSWTYDPRAYDALGREALELMARSLDRIADLVRAHGVELSVVVYPWPQQVLFETDPASSRQVTYWRDWCQKRDVDFVQLFEAFHGTDRPGRVTRYFVPGDVHWNEEGHALVADTLAGHFRGRALVANGPRRPPSLPSASLKLRD
jgi:hypothetical protein